MIGHARPLPSRLVLLGHPVSQSLSPVFQGAALRAAGLTIAYEALDVLPQALPEVVARLRAEGAAGNATAPHKAAVALACDEVTPLAARAGAVNTFWIEDGRLMGDNTDVAGFAAAVDALLGLADGDPWPPRVTVLGGGGAARAVLVAAERRGVAAVDVHVREPARAQQLVDRFPAAQVRNGAPAADTGLVINATPLGMHGDELPVPVHAIPRRAAVFDLVYRRDGATPWVRECRGAGLRASDGLSMLLAQGALAFERFTGLQADRRVMRESLSST